MASPDQLLLQQHQDDIARLRQELAAYRSVLDDLAGNVIPNIVQRMGEVERVLTGYELERLGIGVRP